MIYGCVYNKPIWDAVSKALAKTINSQTIYFGTQSQNENIAISLVSYIIYKDWLTENGESRQRTWRNTVYMFIKELDWYQKIYGSTKMKDCVTMIYDVKMEFESLKRSFLNY